MGKPGQQANTKEKKRFGRTYWMLNIIEMFERLAYFSLRVMAPIYINQPEPPGGLHLSSETKGWIYSWWAVFQSFLPIVTGGYSDRYGYKRMLAVSITTNTAGYIVMGLTHSYAGFFAGVLVLATGTALFKPSLQGCLASTLTKDSASLGWGLFYWIVNVGSLIAHYVAGPLAGDQTVSGWQRLFFAGAVFTSVNFIMLLTFRDVPTGASKTERPLQVLRRTLVNVLEARLIAWLLIMSCFWMMMYQLWDLQPNFITDWVDSSMIAEHLPSFAKTSKTTGLAGIPQERLISLNAALIVLFVVPMSWLVRKMRTLSAMLIGMLVATAGILIAGLTMNGWTLLLGIAFFSFGEMLTGPKKQEYLGLIAPPGKKGLYLGYVNIPVGLGVAIGSYLGGRLYAAYGEKATLALKYLLEKTAFGTGKAWDGSFTTIEAAAGIPRPQAFEKLMEVLNQDGVAVTQLLWDTYHPQLYTWIPFAVIGGVAAVALYVFGQLAKRWSDMNA